LLVVLASSAQATTYVQFSLTDPGFGYISSAREIFIVPEPLSTLTVEKRDSVTNTVLDSTSLTSSPFVESFYADLTFSQNANAPNGWSATGTVSFTDEVFPTPEAMMANFTSTSIGLSGNVTDGYQLSITGLLSPQLGDPMLANRGSPWVFTGNTDGSPDADGNPLTITVENPSCYNGGTATFISNLTFDDVGDVGSLDDLLQGNGFYTAGGSFVGTVTATVPEPLTLAAVAMSLGALGGYLRRRRGNI
jgi:hypothetical protein